MTNGRIRLHRQLQEHSLRLQEPFSRGQAWVDLLMFASHEGGSFRVRGNLITVERGEVAIAETTLAMRRRRSREKVRKFLSDLEKDEMIRQQKNRVCSTYTIANYEKYQTTEQTTEKQQTRQQKNILKNDKNVKEGKEKYIERYTQDEKLREVLNDFVEMRKQLKKPMTTERQFTRLFNKLNEIGKSDAFKIKVVEQSIFHCWQDVYPLKQEDQPKKKDDRPRLSVAEYEQQKRKEKENQDILRSNRIRGEISHFE